VSEKVAIKSQIRARFMRIPKQELVDQIRLVKNPKLTIYLHNHLINNLHDSGFEVDAKVHMTMDVTEKSKSIMNKVRYIDINTFKEGAWDDENVVPVPGLNVIACICIDPKSSLFYQLVIDGYTELKHLIKSSMSSDISETVYTQTIEAHSRDAYATYRGAQCLRPESCYNMTYEKYAMVNTWMQMLFDICHKEEKKAKRAMNERFRELAIQSMFTMDTHKKEADDDYLQDPHNIDG
jgi:hypothetical protein